jgi:parallel beta-helix repeat protein
VAAVFLIVFIFSTALSSSISMDLAEGNYVPWVWHNSHIFIQSDGSIEPSSAPIEKSGNVYRFTTDVFSGIAIQRNDIVLDGNGHKVLGNYYGTGLLLQNVSNITVQNVQVQYFSQGIYLDNCNESTLKGNTIYKSDIEVYQSSGSQIMENNVGRDVSIDFSSDINVTSNNASSISLSWSKNIQISNNRVSDAKRVDVQLSSTNYTEGIYIDNCDTCQIINNTIENKNVGLDIWQSTNLTFSKNVLSENQVGFKMWGSDLIHYTQNIDTTNTVDGKPVYFIISKSDFQVPNEAGWIAAINCKNITVRNWISTPNWDAILFVDTSNLSIVNCTISGNYNAVRFDNVTDSTITENTMSDNLYSAFYAERTEHCLIKDNQIVNNQNFFNILQSENNTIFHNDFVGNQTGYIEEDDWNTWDSGGEGNFWSTFTCVDFNHDGISDVPYLVDLSSNSTDNFPLALPRIYQSSVLENQTGTSSILAVPQEYINYTITDVNETIWAEVQEVCPTHFSTPNGSDLPLLYAMPPNTTDIHVFLNGNEIQWSNFNAIDPATKNQTDIGNLQMIYSLLKSPPTDFLLEINYKHPIQVVNGSYMFLYNLNVSSYLSPFSAKSVAEFNVKLQDLPPNATDLNVFTMGSEEGGKSVNLTLDKNADGATCTFYIVSEYNHELPGDIVMILRPSVVPEFPVWIFPFLSVATAIVIAIYKKKRNRD